MIKWNVHVVEGEQTEKSKNVYEMSKSGLWSEVKSGRFRLDTEMCLKAWIYWEDTDEGLELKSEKKSLDFQTKKS